MIVELLNRLFDYRVIVNCDRDPYLHRWYLFRSERLGIFLHKFVRSDEDRALHDHPWAFVVIPLWRGYIEHSDVRVRHDLTNVVEVRMNVHRRVWPILGTRYRPATYRHRVELVGGRPSWSLFFRFKKIRFWGFWPKTGFVDWQKWWNDLCED